MKKALEKPPFLVEKYLPFIFLVAGLLGFLASFILTIDTIKVLQNPGYTPPCNLNPIISCGSVMSTSQSSVLGFANSLIGIGAFASLATVGLALLTGAKFKRWFWLGLQLAAILTVAFVHWLIFQSLYRIGSLCPYCMVVWTITIPTFWYITLYTLKNSKFYDRNYVKFVYKHHADFLLGWFVVVIGLILNRFWFYWTTLL